MLYQYDIRSTTSTPESLVFIHINNSINNIVRKTPRMEYGNVISRAEYVHGSSLRFGLVWFGSVRSGYTCGAWTQPNHRISGPGPNRTIGFRIGETR